MLFDAAFTDDITIAERSGYDDNGDPTYGSTKVIKARYEGAQSVFTATAGRTEDVRDVILTHAEVTKDHVYWLPSDDVGTDPGREPSEVSRSTTLDGSSTLYEVVL